MGNNQSTFSIIDEYKQKIMLHNDYEAFNSLYDIIETKTLKTKKLSQIFNTLVQIYLEHPDDDFKYLSLCLLGKITKFYEITSYMVEGSSLVFSSALTKTDIDLKREASRAYCELVHRHYHLIDNETTDRIFTSVNHQYKIENDEDIKDSLLWTLGRMSELKLIPEASKTSFYNEIYDEPRSKRDKTPNGIIKILYFFHAQEFFSLNNFEEFIDLLKLNTRYGGMNEAQTAIQGLGILIKNQLISKEQRQDIFEFIFPFLDHSSYLVHSEILTNIVCLLENRDLLEEQKQKISRKIRTFNSIEDAYIRQNITTISKLLETPASLDSKEKRKFERFHFRANLPFDFPIRISTAAEPRLYEDYLLPLDNIRQNIRSYYTSYNSILDMDSFSENTFLIQEIQKVKTLKSKILREDQNDPDIRYLSVIMNNYLDFPDRFSIDPRFTKDNLLSYFEAIYIYKKSNVNFTYDNFKKLLDKANECQDKDYSYRIINLILGRLSSTADFYLPYDDEINLRTIVSSFGNNAQHNLDVLDIVIANQRQRFLNMNKTAIENEHEILRDARILMSSFKAEQTAIPEQNRKYIAVSNLLEGTNLEGRTIDLSIRRLIKFRAHIVSAGLIEFGLNVQQLDRFGPLYQDAFNEFLVEKLTQENYLDSGGYINLDVEYSKQDKANFIYSCIKHTKEFEKEYKLPKGFIDYKFFKKSIEEMLEILLNDRKNARDLMQGFVVKDAVALLFSLQREQCEDLPERYKDSLFPEETNKALKLALRSVTQISLKIDQLLPEPTKIDPSAYKEIGEISKKLTSSLDDNRSLIIPSGTPIKKDEDESKHYFYILIKNCGERKVKLVIVNGGDNLENAVDVDRRFVEIDAKMAGNYWLCRETCEIDISEPNQRTFIKEYIHRALLLPYTRISKDDPFYTRKSLMDNINLISEAFTGFGFAPTRYKPEILPVENRTYSMPSQLFGNCTIFNLQFALRFMFDWNEAQFTQFIHDSYLRFNSFLHRKADRSALFLVENSSTKEGTDILNTSENKDQASFRTRILNEREVKRSRSMSI